MNLQTLRDYVRVQLDMDEEELPNALLDSYFDEAFTRTVSMENRWPFYETRWEVAKIADTPNVSLPTDVNPAGIASVVDRTHGRRLIQIGNELAEDYFVTGQSTANNPTHYSLYGNQLVLWPDPPGDLAREYLIRGYRLPHDWIADGAGSEPDCDIRLHQLLAHYAIALCYAQQEDEVLEDVYMKRWQAGYLAAHNAICQPRHHRPLVLNAGVVGVPSSANVVWSSPPVHS